VDIINAKLKMKGNNVGIQKIEYRIENTEFRISLPFVLILYRGVL
jgi:hypothetical protein